MLRADGGFTLLFGMVKEDRVVSFAFVCVHSNFKYITVIFDLYELKSPHKFKSIPSKLTQNSLLLFSQHPPKKSTSTHSTHHIELYFIIKSISKQLPLLYSTVSIFYQ